MSGVSAVVAAAPLTILCCVAGKEASARGPTSWLLVPGPGRRRTSGYSVVAGERVEHG